jgi:hypothetical protein
MCCGNKKKAPQTTTQQSGVNNTQQANNTSNVQQANNSNASVVPKSTISYSANNFQSGPLENKENYVHTQKMDFTNQDMGDRQSDYAVENNQANKSTLIRDKEILTYGSCYSVTTSMPTMGYPKLLS